ncbi:hypothetical protein GCM10027517_15410 [Phycicoccus ginsengisoli]
MPAGDLDHGIGVGDATGQLLAEGHGVHPRVARGDDHRVDGRVGAERPDDGVLASTGPDDENLHGGQRRGPVGRAGNEESAASRGGRGDILPGTPRSRRAVTWRGNLQPGTWVDRVD